MQTRATIQSVLDEIHYKDWQFYLGTTDLYVQIRFYAPDNDDPTKMELQKCRKWRLSLHMTNSEIVRTAYKAVLAAEEHEASELFKYKDVDIYNPHTDVDVLVSRRLVLGDAMLAKRDPQ